DRPTCFFGLATGRVGTRLKLWLKVRATARDRPDSTRACQARVESGRSLAVALVEGPHTQHTMPVINIDSIHLPLYLYFSPLCDTIELLTFAIHSNPNGSA